MKRSNRLVLLIGIFLAIVAFVLIVLMLGNGGGGGGEPRPSQAPTTANVVVATKDIALGTAIQQDQVGLKEIDLTAKPADSYTDTALVVGQIARQAVTAGQLDHAATIVNRHGLRSRTSRCRAGKVAMSVKVDQVSGVGTVDQGRRLRGRRRGLQHQAHLRRTRTTGPARRPSTIDAGPSVKALLQGMQVLGTLLPAPPQRQAARAERLPGSQRRRLHHPQRPGADRDPRGRPPAGRGPQLLAAQRASRRPTASRWCSAAARTTWTRPGSPSRPAGRASPRA